MYNISLKAARKYHRINAFVLYILLDFVFNSCTFKKKMPSCFKQVCASVVFCVYICPYLPLIWCVYVYCLCRLAEKWNQALTPSGKPFQTHVPQIQFHHHQCSLWLSFRMCRVHCLYISNIRMYSFDLIGLRWPIAQILVWVIGIFSLSDPAYTWC